MDPGHGHLEDPGGHLEAAGDGGGDLQHLGVEALAHLHAAVGEEHRAVQVHADEGARLVEPGSNGDCPSTYMETGIEGKNLMGVMASPLFLVWLALLKASTCCLTSQ